MNITTEHINGVTMQVMPDGTRQPIEDKTDWARLNAMTEAEIEAAALADEDNPPLTQAELKRMRRVPNPKETSKRLQMMQQHKQPSLNCFWEH